MENYHPLYSRSLWSNKWWPALLLVFQEKPSNCALKPLLKRYLCGPIETVPRLRGVRVIAIDIAGARRRTDGRIQFDPMQAEHCGEPLDQFADSDLDISSDLKDFAADLPNRGSSVNGIDDIVYIDEVTGLAPIAVDLPWLAGKRLANEFRDDAAFVA